MDEHMDGSVGEGVSDIRYFDAFVSYAQEDLNFIKQMIINLEENLCFSLCLPGRDLLPGEASYSAQAGLIEHRCKKVIALVSQPYLSSPECGFLTEFIQSKPKGFKNQKLIVVVIPPLGNVQIPDILKSSSFFEYTDWEVKDRFWNQLKGSFN